MKKFFKKYFGLPTPRSLPIRRFQNNENEYCWEDWRNDMKSQYPVRYFINEILPMWFRCRIFMPIDELIYNLKSKYIKKYHLIDIRQLDQSSFDHYDCGYIDAGTALVLSMFTLLIKHCKELDDCKYVYKARQSSIAELRGAEESAQADALEEMMKLKYYWLYERKEFAKKIDNAVDEWHRAHKDKSVSKEISHELLEQVTKLESEFSDDEEEKLIRLVKLRKSLWL